MTAALAYAREGYRVFPVRTNKQPATARGFNDATTDTDQIRTWWADDGDYLIGIANGNGLLVMDVDNYKAGEAAEWETFIAAHGGLPATRTVRTGSGGVHYWFSTDTDVPRALGLFPSVDACGSGGYTIAPPSTSSAGTYTLLSDEPVAAAPAWLIEAILARKAVAVTRPFDLVPLTALSPADAARCAQYADRVFELELERLRACTRSAVPSSSLSTYAGPEWNRTTFEVACNLLEIVNSPWNALGEADAYAALIGAAPRDAGFTEADVVARWDSARKKVGHGSRPMPPARGGGVFVPFSAGTPAPTTTPASFFAPKEGLDTLLLATAVCDLGPLAVDNTENRAIWSYRNGVWQLASNEVSDRVALLLGPKFRASHITTVMPMIRQTLSARGEVITCEPQPDYINVLNGMLHWTTGTLYNHDPSFHSTVQLPVEWNPEATCPNFDAFAREVMAEDAIDYLWEMIGYLVYSGNPFQRAFLFKGAGINGKGTLIRVLTSLLGRQNVSAVTLTDLVESRFEQSSLYGKIANIAGDIDATYMKSTAKFKQITGEDEISAERKYEHSFKFVCWAVPVFSANEFWKSADTTTGYRRRWQLLPFPHSFAGTSDHRLTARLTAETPGILVHAVESLRTLLERGDFDAPRSAREEKEKFELAADQVSEWLTEDVCVVVADPGNVDTRCISTDAYRAYRHWSEASGNSPLPSSKWWQRMEALGYFRAKSNGVRKIQGLGINAGAALTTGPAL